MRLLFAMDSQDYDPRGKAFVRNSARCVTIRAGKIAMVHSLKLDYYKFPGGGIEAGESRENAMMRETREEAGLTVIPASVREYGYVHRAHKSIYPDEEYFVQDNYYYLCKVEEEICDQKLDAYEAEERFTLEWVEPRRAVEANRRGERDERTREMLEREARVLEMLIEEGYFA